MNKDSTYWQEDEPNVNEFDYNTREFSPITKEGAEACSSNPAFDCFIQQDGTGGTGFTCQTEGESSSFFVPSNTIKDIDDIKDVETSCPPNSNCEITVPNNALFVKFDLIKATTNDADPACMAITSPNVLQAANEIYDKCSLTFDFTEDVERYFYAKWLDLKCNQRTRALMCTVVGTVISLIS